MQEIVDAITAGDTPQEDFAHFAVPQSYRGVTVHKDETAMFEGRASRDKDPRESLHLDEVPTPELGPGEAIVAVMASALNYNTVWSSIFEPVSTFSFLERYGRTSPLASRHDLPYHVVGSDLAGVVLRTGPGGQRWQPGDEVVAHCLSVELESPDGHNDTMLDPEQRIWGFETNFGGLAELALVKTNQLMPKPRHLTWEEAASPGLVNSTAYRQLVSAQRREHEAGRHRPRLGRERRSRLVRDPARTQRRCHTGVHRVGARRRRRSARAHGCRARHRPLGRHRRELPLLEGRATPRTPRSGIGSASTSATSPAATTSTSCSSTRVARPSARACTSRARGGTIVTCASTSGLPARVRQPLPLDEPQANHRLPLRQLPRSVGG